MEEKLFGISEIRSFCLNNAESVTGVLQGRPYTFMIFYRMQPEGGPEDNIQSEAIESSAVSQNIKILLSPSFFVHFSALLTNSASS